MDPYKLCLIHVSHTCNDNSKRRLDYQLLFRTMSLCSPLLLGEESRTQGNGGNRGYSKHHNEKSFGSKGTLEYYSGEGLGVFMAGLGGGSGGGGNLKQF